MDNAEKCDMIVEAFEVFLNHILYVREVYPAKVFAKRRVYNTPIYVCTYPAINTYFADVLRTTRELQLAGELKAMYVLLFRSEYVIYERYKFNVCEIESELKDDAFLIEFEEHLRASLFMMSQRLKCLPKLPKDVKCKIQLCITQAASVRLNENAHFQDFPWIRSANTVDAGEAQIGILPLTTANNIGIEIMLEAF